MKPALEISEIGHLTRNFRFTTRESSNHKGSINAAALSNSEKCLAYIKDIEEVFDSPSAIVTASQFSKRYSFLTAAPCLYAMSVFSKGMDLSIENTYIEADFLCDQWVPDLRLSDLRVSMPNQNRFEWRERVLTSLFSGNITKIWDSLSAATRVPKAILWENTAVYVFWLYEKKIGEKLELEAISRAEEDFHYLINEAPGWVFGESENPLKKYYTSVGNEQSVRIRKTCCLYHKLKNSTDFCSNCPTGNCVFRNKKSANTKWK
ncbi:IucA/IucC family C-terminal-domain containing protein [Bacillus sp. M6-12]|uniref:IucA/IucC family C-terminal-domain containing protein n=1 Tax=Bacillus sp. M6-12 TaxID=2054166 RepID=UPI0015E0E402|nr:IucA/IucC family C-terminal-domain containing protein [Bacillus sp. M6-12]